ncbi:MAG: hypothetical protein LBL13_04715 [Bacteroidales bacterium]|jgi:hypothetical protein|nr:hypothetical protein [Bacteroidales bacterium]
MNLRFFGDERDAFKFSLLEKLCKGLGIGLTYVPMLTQDDPEKRNEGKKEAPKDDERFDPDLIEMLEKCKKIKLAALPDNKKLPDECVVEKSSEIIGLISSYFSKKHINFKCTPEDNRLLLKENRLDYFNKINIEDKAQLIFFDPDTGLSKTGHEKHLCFCELKDFFDNLNENAIIVIYQHRGRLERWDTVPEKKINYLPKNTFAFIKLDGDVGCFIFVKKSAKFNEIKDKTAYDLQIYN